MFRVKSLSQKWIIMLNGLTNDAPYNIIKIYYMVRQITKKDALKQMF